MKKLVLMAAIAAGLLFAVPSAAAECTPFSEWECEREYRDNDGNRLTDDYTRGGVATNYFPWMRDGRDVIRDGLRNERPRYDDRHRGYRSGGYDSYRDSGYRDNGYGHHGYEHKKHRRPAFRFDSNVENHPLRWSEGFVKGEGYGDEYIGDPDQLGEEVWSPFM